METVATNEGTLAQTDIHDVLRNDRRRRVLARLHESGGCGTVTDLADFVAAEETGKSPPPRKARQSVYVSLHQTHLPKLDELGIATYDSETKQVRLSDNAADVTVYLEVVPEYGISRAEFFLGLATLGLLLVAGSMLGVPLLASVGPAAWGALTLVAVGVAAGVYVVDQNETVFDRVR